MSDTTSEPRTFTIDEAIALLPDGEYVHTFLNGFGADWLREQIVDALREAPRIIASGPNAQAIRHGFAIPHPRAPHQWLLVATKQRTDGAA